MLILAGVSLNAIVGDNGIISNAQTATMKSSMAVLEEFLQEKYVENYEDFSENIVSKVALLKKIYPEFFYNPSRDSGIGALDYVVDSDGHALYLIKKSGLPNEIKKQLKGGDAGGVKLTDAYIQYQSLTDVYGVTSDLKVYYSSGGTDSLLGITGEELDLDDPARKVFSSSSVLSSYLVENGFDSNKDGDIDAQEVKSVKELNIPANSNIENLNEIYNLTSLEKLTLTNIKMTSLAGLENCPRLYYIFLNNCIISDYSAIGKLGSKLQHLYIYNINDEELATLCSKSATGIGNYDLINLEYFGIIGNTSILTDSYGIMVGPSSPKGSKTITNVQCLNELSTKTKFAVSKLCLNNNNITSLEGLEEFENLYFLRVEYNKLKDFKGIENANLTYLYSSNNLLGNDEIYNISVDNSGKNENTDSLSFLTNHSNLYYLDLNYNENLRWISYLKDKSNLRYLYLTNCLYIADMPTIKSVVIGCGINVKIDTSYSLDLLDESNTTFLDLTGQEITISNLESIGKCTKITKLNLKNIILKDNSGSVITNSDTLTIKLGECLEKLRQLKSLNLQGISGMKNINFIGTGKVDKLSDLNLIGTAVTDLRPLNSISSYFRGGLALDNAGSNISEIQSIISRTKRTGCMQMDFSLHLQLFGIRQKYVKI